MTPEAEDQIRTTVSNWFQEIAAKSEEYLRNADPKTLGPAGRRLMGYRDRCQCRCGREGCAGNAS